MDDMKLIMESWRAFVNTTTVDLSLVKSELDKISEPSQVEEGLGTALKLIAAMVVGGQEVQINQAELDAAQSMMNRIEQSADADGNFAGVDVDQIRVEFDKIVDQIQSIDGAGVDADGDNVSDMTVDVDGDSPGEVVAGQIFLKVDKPDSQSKTKSPSGSKFGLKAMQKINKGGPGKSGQLDFMD